VTRTMQTKQQPLTRRNPRSRNRTGMTRQKHRIGTHFRRRRRSGSPWSCCPRRCSPRCGASPAGCCRWQGINQEHTRWNVQCEQGVEHRRSNRQNS
jgi:hypothetical protein